MSGTVSILQYSGLDKHQESSEGQRLPFLADLFINKLAPSVRAYHRIIERRVSDLKELLKEPSNWNLIKPILLDFDDSHDISDDEVQDNGKGKAKVDKEDLSKPFKEVLKCPFTRRIVEFLSPGHWMPANVKIYDGIGDPKDRVGRFMGIGNQGEWPMPVWCRMFQQTLNGKARAWFDKLPSGSIDN
ncbi:hypothetical protein Tco_1221753 [Tanacetum coccineum]